MIFPSLKDDAFKNGFALTSYMKVIAVMARDRFFQENGISIETPQTDNETNK